MSPEDPINAIEDEPYEGLYRGAVAQYAHGRDHLPDRFDLADILRSTREARGWSVEQVEELTRVRRSYIEALETAAYDVLPPRAFAIGYVKAYAKALGLDEETLADMFKRDVSDQNPRLQAPSGASLDDVKPNYRLYITAALCLVAAVVIWNIVQRKPINFAKPRHDAELSNQAWSMGVPLIKEGVVRITPSVPAPKDQDIPAPYVTPGLEEGFASLAAARNQDEVAPVPVQDVLTRKAFNPHGAIYGAPPEQSVVTLQAKSSVNLVVRGPDNTIFFAHQLGVGEAYRVPQNDTQSLAIDVSNFTAFEVYYNGIYAGTLEALVTPVSKINARAAQISAQMDAKQAAQGQINTIYSGATPAPAPQRPTYQPKSTAPIPYVPSKPAGSASAAPAASQP